MQSVYFSFIKATTTTDTTATTAGTACSNPLVVYLDPVRVPILLRTSGILDEYGDEKF